MRWLAVQRVWLPEWLRRRDVVVAQLKVAVEEARQRVRSGDIATQPAEPTASVAPLRQLPPPTQAVAPLRQLPPPTQVIPVSKPKAPKGHRWCRCIASGSRGDLVTSAARRSRPTITRRGACATRFVGAIEKEAPIHEYRLAKIVGAAFHLTKVNESRRMSIHRVVPVEYLRRGGESFYWPRNFDPKSGGSFVARPRCEPATGRDLPGRDRNVMMIVAEQTGGIEPEDLKCEELNLLGSRPSYPSGRSAPHRGQRPRRLKAGSAAEERFRV